MGGLYESIMQSRFPRLKIDESIMDTIDTRKDRVIENSSVFDVTRQIVNMIKLRPDGWLLDDIRYIQASVEGLHHLLLYDVVGALSPSKIEKLNNLAKEICSKNKDWTGECWTKTYC